jgi:hypothetical protein
MKRSTHHKNKIIKAAKELNIEYVVVSNVTTLRLTSNKVRAVVLSDSDWDLNETTTQNRMLNAYALDLHVPTLGVGYGAHMINILRGGTLEVITRTFETLKFSRWIAKPDSFASRVKTMNLIVASHDNNKGIKVLGKSLKIFATDEQDNIRVICDSTGILVGLLFDPIYNPLLTSMMCTNKLVRNPSLQKTQWTILPECTTIQI